MPSSYTSLHYHLIFSTKDRQPWLDPGLRPRLYEYMGAILRDHQGRLLAAGGVADHVHLLAGLHPTLAVAEALRIVKAGASKWLHETFPELTQFAWQDGYAAFTVSRSGLDDVVTYIAGQEAHHRRVSFQDEYLTFLRRHELPFDERYVWG